MEQIILNSYSRLSSLNVSRETFLDFESFISMIIEKNKEINIISKETAKTEVIRDRHIIDSAQIIDFVDLNSNTTTDLGTGGGMPGTIIAIILKNMKKIREIWKEIPYFDKEIDEQIEINAHYRGYLKKQKADILAFKRDENLIIPEKVNYDELSGLSNEVKAKFKEIRPKTMGQALRIDGITPAAVYILLSHVKRKSIKHIA